MAKTRYKVRNWPEYNRALKERYRLTIMVSEEIFSGWYAERSGTRGAPRRYSDVAITFALTIRLLFHLPLRGCEGVLKQLVALLGLAVPDYTTLCRRGKRLAVRLPRLKRGGHLWMAVDASGLKVSGEGEWKVRMHGAGKRRTWRKLHIGVDVETGEIVAGAMTTADVHDSQVLANLLEGAEGPIEAVAGDGAYDTRDNYEAISNRGARAVIPPRRGSRVWRHGNRWGSPLPRDETLRYIRRHGRKKWKQESGYHRRSLAETTFFRLKTIFDEKLSARLFENQETEALLRLAILNRMTAIGMPHSYPVNY